MTTALFCLVCYKDKGEAPEEPHLRASYGARSMLDPLCRWLRSFSTAVFVLREEEHNAPLKRGPLHRRGRAEAPWESGFLSSPSQRKAEDGFCVVSVHKFI